MLFLQKKYSKSLIVVALLLSLTACSSSQSPVSSRETTNFLNESEKLGGRLVTITQRGETLFSIAFENSLDVSELAAWNGLSDASKIRVGQRIRLTKPIGFVDKPSRTQTIVASRKPVQSSPIVNQPKIPERSSSVNRSNTVARNNPSSNNVVSQSPVRWQWPVRGRVINRFSVRSGNKGIDIATNAQQQVRTAAAGKVVYQGRGIKGYGNLIIIKHNQQYLSAYAHNAKVMVTEGQQVKSGQVISLAGSHDGRNMLHFEIRQNGKPIDPLKYLP